MGYDKPDLAFCVHLGSPSSPVAYYQQVGRAGRQLDHALGVLLPAGDTDEQLWAYFATASLPDPQLAAPSLSRSPTGRRPCSISRARPEAGAARLEALLKQLHVDGAVRRDGSQWCATGQGWVYDQAKYDAVIAERRAEAGLMRQYASGARCLMQVLIEALDDPAAQPCGRCSACTGNLPPPGAPARPRDRACRGCLPALPRPGSSPHGSCGPEVCRGRAGSSPAPRAGRWPTPTIRAGRSWSPNWTVQTPRRARNSSTPSSGSCGTGGPPSPLRSRPSPTPTHPLRIAGIVEALSTRLRLPVIDALTWTGPAGARQARIRSARGRRRRPASMGARRRRPDSARSSWSARSHAPDGPTRWRQRCSVKQEPPTSSPSWRTSSRRYLRCQQQRTGGVSHRARGGPRRVARRGHCPAGPGQRWPLPHRRVAHRQPNAAPDAPAIPAWAGT